MLIDLHNHTSRYSPCSVLEPPVLCAKAEAAGLDGIAITEHDTYFPQRHMTKLREHWEGRLVIFSGIEISIPGYHVLTFGAPIPAGPYHDLGSLRTAADASSNALVLAHPFRWGAMHRFHSDRELLGFLRSFDAVEVFSMNLDASMQQDGHNFFTAHDIPMAAGSDAHSPEMCASYATRFSSRPQNDLELAAALRAGSFTPERIRA